MVKKLHFLIRIWLFNFRFYYNIIYRYCFGCQTITTFFIIKTTRTVSLDINCIWNRLWLLIFNAEFLTKVFVIYFLIFPIDTRSKNRVFDPYIKTHSSLFQQVLLLNMILRNTVKYKIPKDELCLGLRTLNKRVSTSWPAGPD